MALLDVIAGNIAGGTADAAGIQGQFSRRSARNLDPFIELGQQALPGLQAGANPVTFFDTANALRPAVEGLTQPILQERLRALNAGLGASGQTRSGFAGIAAADIQQDLDLDLLSQLQQQFTSRGQGVAGQGLQAAQGLAQLGQQSSQDIASRLSQGVLTSQQARTAQQQNLLGLAGLGADFIPGFFDNQTSPALNPSAFLNSPNASQFIGAA